MAVLGAQIGSRRRREKTRGVATRGCRLKQAARLGTARHGTTRHNCNARLVQYVLRNMDGMCYQRFSHGELNFLLAVRVSRERGEVERGEEHMKERKGGCS